jgi:hypothetical protein
VVEVHVDVTVLRVSNQQRRLQPVELASVHRLQPRGVPHELERDELLCQLVERTHRSLRLLRLCAPSTDIGGGHYTRTTDDSAQHPQRRYPTRGGTQNRTGWLRNAPASASKSFIGSVMRLSRCRDHAMTLDTERQSQRGRKQPSSQPRRND